MTWLGAIAHATLVLVTSGVILVGLAAIAVFFDSMVPTLAIVFVAVFIFLVLSFRFSE